MKYLIGIGKTEKYFQIKNTQQSAAAAKKQASAKKFSVKKRNITRTVPAAGTSRRSKEGHSTNTVSSSIVKKLFTGELFMSLDTSEETTTAPPKMKPKPKFNQANHVLKTVKATPLPKGTRQTHKPLKKKTVNNYSPKANSKSKSFS